MKILFAHLLNNFTGSPRVLANILEGLEEYLAKNQGTLLR